ncbi:MAG: SGNH/GDSL hydrolase family protein [Clostridia bacterium]|nr:SGNH/GDSL hydrolase family protein [Clostridia bacterium]
MKRIVTIIILAALALSLANLSGCSWLDGIFHPESGRLDFGSNEAVETPDAEYEPLYDVNGDRLSDAPLTSIELRARSVSSAEHLTSERIAGGTLYAGNLIRLARLLKRCEAAFAAEETAPYFSSEDSAPAASRPDPSIDRSPVTVGFCGSGAMAGEGVEYMKDAYPFAIRRWFADAYGSDNFNFLFRGVSGSDSRYGAHDVGRNLINDGADVVFLDYSVADMKNPEARETFEVVVRRLLTAEKPIAVVILCTMDASCNSDFETELEIARAYGCPVISLRHAVAQELADGKFFFSSLTDDGFNLGLNGHALFGELVANFLENVRRQLDKINTDADIPVPAVGLTPCRYMNGWLFTNYKRPVSFGSFVRYGLRYDIFDRAGWECATPGGAPLVYQADAQYITLMYWRVTDRTGGRMEVYVDGAHAATLECDYIDGAENCAGYATVYAGSEYAAHTIEIYMSSEKNKGSTGERVCLLAIMTA